ncbi:hypothetical protein V1477_012140 [Vespula maculifrons]|uniref:Uncharacterized protein n=1 Tax=Vespula maculifrons TaxID=7453 RepID=A0ABD2BWN1_VESMC
MAFIHVLILPCCHSKCSYIEVMQLFDHANFANFRVESPSAHGFPDAATSRDLDSALSGDFKNLSPPVDLEIFTPLRDFDNLSLRVDLEIFTG